MNKCPLCKQTVNAVKKNKYLNKKIEIDGLKFDSIKESSRYWELSMLIKIGSISDLKRQVKFELVPKQNGERAINYFADFTYIENGNMVVEDVKSSITRKNLAYTHKRKLMLQVHGVKIKEV